MSEDLKYSAEDTVEESLERISKLVIAVQEQGPLGQLVVIVHNSNENPYVTLQNAFSTINIPINLSKDNTNLQKFYLRLGKEVYAEGKFPNLQTARQCLAAVTLEKLKKMCFFIYEKQNFVNVTKGDLQETSKLRISLPEEKHSIAYKMMMQMGWTGGGLGAQEQGDVNSVCLTENINRQGLGSDNQIEEITKKIKQFSESLDILTLVFDENFTKKQRLHIHKIARKFNLKSKSRGSTVRKLTISRKITRMDIVKQLLNMGGEDGLYKLQTPSNFAHL